MFTANYNFKGHNFRIAVIFLVFLYVVIYSGNWIINPLNTYRPLYTYKYYYNNILEKEIFPEAVPEKSVFRYLSPSIQYSGGAILYIETEDEKQLNGYIPNLKKICKTNDEEILDQIANLCPKELSSKFANCNVNYITQTHERNEGYIIAGNSMIIFSI